MAPQALYGRQRPHSCWFLFLEPSIEIRPRRWPVQSRSTAWRHYLSGRTFAVTRASASLGHHSSSTMPVEPIQFRRLSDGRCEPRSPWPGSRLRFPSGPTIGPATCSRACRAWRALTERLGQALCSSSRPSLRWGVAAAGAVQLSQRSVTASHGAIHLLSSDPQCEGFPPGAGWCDASPPARGHSITTARPQGARAPGGPINSARHRAASRSPLKSGRSEAASA